MGRPVKIDINGTSYILSFGYRATRLLGSYLGEESFDGTIARIMNTMTSLGELEESGDIESGKLPFEMLDTLGFLVLSTLPAGSDAELDDCVDFVLKNMEKFSEIMAAWVESMPLAKQQKKTGTKKAQQNKKVRPAAKS
nr:hypothetical protein [Allomuricauda sp.]